MQLRCIYDWLLFFIVHKEASEDGHVELGWNDVVGPLTVRERTYLFLDLLDELHVRLNVEARFAHRWAHANAVTKEFIAINASMLQTSFLFRVI